RYFEDLIQSYLLDNPHHTTVILEPDPTVSERNEADERARLEAVRATLSGNDLQAMVEQTQKLREMQNEPDSPAALATIPMLKLEDLDKENQLIPIEI